MGLYGLGSSDYYELNSRVVLKFYNKKETFNFKPKISNRFCKLPSFYEIK